jgi:hypothetical protein
MNPGEEPKISAGKALSAARQQLSKAFADGRAWQVQRIWLERFPEPPGLSFGLKDRWFYEVAFAPPEALKGGYALSQEYPIYVLMDGSGDRAY